MIYFVKTPSSNSRFSSNVYEIFAQCCLKDNMINEYGTYWVYNLRYGAEILPTVSSVSHLRGKK